jgi:hypothetical protein
MKLDLSDKTIWQIGSGDSSRDYSKVFLDFGVALVGPGDPGDERNPETAEYYNLNESVKNWGMVLKQIKKNHWIILRKGRKIIKAVGEVNSEYDYIPIFGDVDGWDLQHSVKVDWYLPQKDICFDKSILSMSTLEACYNSDVHERISQEDFEKHLPKYNFNNFKIPNEITIKDISKSLINNGVRIQDAENISNTIERIIKLAKWYYENDYYVLEHEIRTLLVIPLLISLGWSEQKIKIEYNKIDIAIFRKPFIGDYKLSPHIIIETKKFDDGLSYTNNQIINYSKMYPDCKLLITTNGFRYKIYEKSGNDFIEIAYLNLFNLRAQHYLYRSINGAIDALIKLSNF